MANANSTAQKSFEYSKSIIINYEVYGDGNIPVILLHGFGASLNSWYDIKDLFPFNKYRLFLIDLKGFGLSSKPKDNNYTIEEQANIILKFIENQALKNIILIGHSYGGGVALLTQLKMNDINQESLTNKLILIDCAAYDEEMPFFIKYLKTPIVNSLVLNLFSSNFRARYTLNHLFFNKEKVTKDRINRYAELFRLAGTNYTFIKVAKQLIPNNHRSIIEKYNTIKTPTLIIWGENDPALSLKNGKRLQKEIPNSQLDIINNCGHIPQEECPEETFNSIISFIGRD